MPRLTYAERLRRLRALVCAEILTVIYALIIFGWCVYMLIQVANDLVIAASLQIIRWGRP